MSASVNACSPSIALRRYASRLGVSGLLLGLSLATPAAHADIAWSWSYSGVGLAAGGTLVTGNEPTAGGWYEALSISGQRNGVAILGLQPTGTAVPGNEAYPVDNLIQQADPLLTFRGPGYALADGTYANFYSDLGPGSSGTVWYEYFSAAPFVANVMGPEDSETSLTSISITPLGAPSSLLLLSLGLGGMVTRLGARRTRYSTPA